MLLVIVLIAAAVLAYLKRQALSRDDLSRLNEDVTVEQAHDYLRRGLITRDEFTELRRTILEHRKRLGESARDAPSDESRPS